MAVVLGVLLLFLAITGHSSATYCICKDGIGDSAMQKDIDYACGAGANCSPILEKGACYNPNTVKDHCNYAVNSYYQNKGQAVGSCDFSGTAVITQTIAGQSSTCVYPTSASSSTPGISTTGGGFNSTGFPTGGSSSFGGVPPTGISDTSKAAPPTFSHLFFFWPFTLILISLRP